MYLSMKTTIHVSDIEANYIGHMNYAAYKLWNVCNYERHNYKDLGLDKCPNWYDQKAKFKDNMWYKSLPSQTAQEVCNQLDQAWKSFFALKESGGIANPKPPRYKHDNMPITYIQKGMQHHGSGIRLSIPKALKAFMKTEYQLNEKYLFIESPAFNEVDTIKQLKIYPPQDGTIEVIVVYQVPDVATLPDNGRYLSIDMGVHNFATCVNSATGESFIAGRKYLSICRKYDKEIGRIQSQWYSQQAAKGIKYPKSSKRIKSLYAKKNACTNDYLHKMSKAIVAYCVANDISRMIIGDITGVRKDKDSGKVTNLQLRGLPYKRLTDLLTYKCAKHGIVLIKQNEAWSSQCSPLSPCVSKRYATKSNRKHRGLYVVGKDVWNADCVGAYNILRLYLNRSKNNTLPPEWKSIKTPYVLKVAA